jgi:glycogen(starch) synthase
LRVLLVSRHHGAEVRGATVATHGLARALRDRGHEITLVHSAEPEHRLELDGIAIDYYRTTRKSLYPLLYACRRLGAFDVIHTNDESGAYFALRSGWSRLPLVAHIHASVAKARSFWQANWRWRYIELAVRHAPVLISPSRWAADQLAGRFGRDRSHFRVVPNGIGEHWFAARQARLAQPRLTRRLALVNMQGVDTALRALARLPSELDVRLELYGAHKQVAEHRKLAQELGVAERVEFCGFVSNQELPQRMARADMLIHPSRRESFGQVLGEAAALGLPVVASRVDAIPEVVREGETGLLCPPDESEAFAVEIEDLLTDEVKRRRLGDQARARAERLWRWHAVAVRIEKEVYEPLAVH